MNTLRITVNGINVKDIKASDIDDLLKKDGYLDNGIVDVRFLGATPTTYEFVVLSFDNMEGQWLISTFYVEDEHVGFSGSVEADYNEDHEDEARKFFNEYK